MSSNNIEIEAKVLLSKENYDRLLKALGFPLESVYQVNYYLDSKDQILKKYGIVLRIRQMDQQFVFTIKAPLSEGLLQKDQILTAKQAAALIDQQVFPQGEIHNFLEMLQIDPEKLLVLASLTTVRRFTSYKDTKLDISQNSYGDTVDYELECDSDSAKHSQETLKEICTQNKVPYVLNTVSKEDRAITAKLSRK